VKRLKTNPPEGLATPASAIRLAVVGASGRMGTAILSLAAEDPAFDVAMRVGRAGPKTRKTLDSSGIEVVIDVSSEEGAAVAIELALSSRAALLVGTTGLSPAILARAREAAERVAVMVAPNFSLGIAILRRLVAEACRLAGPEWQIDLVETHHRGKRDAPSGTAIALAQEVERARGESDLAGRIHSIRAGGCIGEHEIRLAAEEESLLLRHTALDRRLFARGALRAARWLAGRGPGWHAFEEAVAPTFPVDRHSGADAAESPAAR
jgi:4-hydroxy-tetrahydrodipicolinate reductase